MGSSSQRAAAPWQKKVMHLEKHIIAFNVSILAIEDLPAYPIIKDHPEIPLIELINGHKPL